MKLNKLLTFVKESKIIKPITKGFVIVFLIIMSLGVVNAYVLNSSVLSYYQFENASNVGYDTTTNFDGTNIGSINISSINSTFGSARSFDGVNDYFNAGNRVSNLTKSFTFYGYIDSTGTFDANTPFFSDIGNVDTLGNYIISRIYNSPSQLIFAQGPQWSTGAVTRTNNQWIHYALTCDGTTVKYYRDGESVVNISDSFCDMTNKSANFMLALEEFDSAYSKVRLDEVAFFENTLTQQDIKEIMTQGIIIEQPPSLTFNNITINNISNFNNTYYNSTPQFLEVDLSQENSNNFTNTTIYIYNSSDSLITTNQFITNSMSGSYNISFPYEGTFKFYLYAENNETNVTSSNYTIHYDQTPPTINNTLPTEINTYNLGNISNYVTCQDIGSGTCIIEFEPDNTTLNTTEFYNFTYNGNQSYTITARDNAGNQLQESGVILVNPNQSFRFFDNVRSLYIENYMFGSYSSSGQYVTIPIYDLGLGNQSLEFVKSGYETESFSFTFTNTTNLNQTFNVTPATLFLRVFNELDINEQLTVNITILNSTTSTIYYNELNFSLPFNETITGDIEILIESQGYSDRYFFTTFNENSSVSLILYLMPTASTDQVIFRTLNSVNENVVEEATLNFYRVINGNRIFVGQAVTDANGFTSFAMDSTLKYEIIITKDDFITQQFDSLPGRLDYTILLNPSAIIQTWLFKDFNYQFIPSSNTIDSLPFNFSVRYLDSDNLVSLATFTISGTGFSYSNSSTNANGDILNISVNNITNKYTATLTIIRDGQTYTFNKLYTYYNESNYNTTITNVATLLDGEDNSSERYFMMIIGIVIFASVGAVLGGASAGALAIIVPLILYSYVDWMPLSLSILFISFIIMGVLSFSR